MNVPQGRNEKFQNELMEECIKKGWEPLHYSVYLGTSGEEVRISDEAERVQSVSYLHIRSLSGLYTAEVDKKWSLDSAEADSTCFLRVRSPKSFFTGGGGFRFFSIIFLHIWNSSLLHSFCKVSWNIRFADTALSFSVVKRLFLHLVLLSVCKI